MNPAKKSVTIVIAVYLVVYSVSENLQTLT